MGWRFRRTLRILPGLRLNISKGGVSTSVGGHGLTANISRRGLRTTAGLLGTGLSYTKLHSGNREQQISPQAAPDGSRVAMAVGWVTGRILARPLAAGLGVLLLLAWFRHDSPRTETPAPVQNNTSPSPATVYAQHVVNCRSRADMDAPVAAVLRKGAALTPTESVGVFSRVWVGDKDCYVSADLLSPTVPRMSERETMRLQTGAVVAGALAIHSIMKPGATQAHAAPPRHRPSAVSSHNSIRSPGDACSCAGAQNCTGPRGGKYCITSGGNKRYRH